MIAAEDLDSSDSGLDFVSLPPPVGMDDDVEEEDDEDEGRLRSIRS